MSVEQNQAVVRRYCDEVVNEGNVAILDELWAKDLINHGLAPGLIQGVEGVRQLLVRYHTAFPDLKFTIEDMITEGDKVAIRLTMTGTHQGELLGIAPSGKKVEVTTIAIYRFDSGKIVETWGVRDNLKLMQQIGAIS